MVFKSPEPGVQIVLYVLVKQWIDSWYCPSYLFLNNKLSLKLSGLQQLFYQISWCWGQEFERGSAGRFLVPCSIDWGHSVIFSWWLGCFVGSRMTLAHRSDPLVKMAEGWAQLKLLPEILLCGLSSHFSLPEKFSGESDILRDSFRAPVENVPWERK